MDASILIVLLAIIAIAGIAFLAFAFVGNEGSRNAGIRELMGATSAGSARKVGGLSPEEEEYDVEKIKEFTGRAKGTKKQDDTETKLFKAGLYTEADAQRFKVFQIVAFFASPIVVGTVFIFLNIGTMLTISGFVIGIFIGLVMPQSYLDRRIRLRQEDMFYYLPLVIEQVSIGVSSSLDIGPCISHIVTMANERRSHNPVTQMFIHVEKLVRSGLNLEGSLQEVGEATGMSEVKHAFMFLAQCSKHGGEISRQLQELADAIMVQRQVQIEGKITALPVKATGPLAMVFAGFFALLFSGLLSHLMAAFGA